MLTAVTSSVAPWQQPQLNSSRACKTVVLARAALGLALLGAGLKWARQGKWMRGVPTALIGAGTLGVQIHITKKRIKSFEHRRMVAKALIEQDEGYLLHSGWTGTVSSKEALVSDPWDKYWQAATRIRNPLYGIYPPLEGSNFYPLRIDRGGKTVLEGQIGIAREGGFFYCNENDHSGEPSKGYASIPALLKTLSVKGKTDAEITPAPNRVFVKAPSGGL